MIYPNPLSNSLMCKKNGMNTVPETISIRAYFAPIKRRLTRLLSLQQRR